MSSLSLLFALLTAAGLGGLIGLEREIRIQSKAVDGETAGLRTFAMLSALGFLSTYLTQKLPTSWLIPLFFVSCFAFILFLFGNQIWHGKILGITSELASLASFSVGVLVALDEMFLAISVSILFTGLLALENFLHNLAHDINQKELLAILKFLIISFVVFKVVPVEWTDPWGFFEWRLQFVWLMVVLVTALRFIGYFLSKFFGAQKSILLSGIVGGLVSSTAVTTGLAQESKAQKEHGHFLTAILIATGIMFFRVIFLVSLLAPNLLQLVLWPLLTMSILSFLFVLRKVLQKRKDGPLNTKIKISQPFELRSALMFGLFFLAILFVSEKLHALSGGGSIGLMATGAIAGLTDVDAITLAMANLAKSNTLVLHLAALVILIAVFVNTLVKAAIILLFGSRSLFRDFFWQLLFILAGGILTFSLFFI